MGRLARVVGGANNSQVKTLTHLCGGQEERVKGLERTSPSAQSRSSEQQGVAARATGRHIELSTLVGNNFPEVLTNTASCQHRGRRTLARLGRVPPRCRRGGHCSGIADHDSPSAPLWKAVGLPLRGLSGGCLWVCVGPPMYDRGGSWRRHLYS